MPFALKILVAPDPKIVGVKYQLAEGGTVAGRSGPLKLDGPKVSKEHCRFSVAEGRLDVEDLGSANGIYVNGKRRSQSRLKPKDRLVVGEFVLEVTEI